MSLYLCGEKYKINLNGISYCMHLFSSNVSGIRLSSSDGFILKDYYGLYLTAKDGE